MRFDKRDKLPERRLRELRPARPLAGSFEELQWIEEQEQRNDRHSRNERSVAFHAEESSASSLFSPMGKAGPCVYVPCAPTGSLNSFGLSSILAYWARVYAHGSLVFSAESFPRKLSRFA